MRLLPWLLQLSRSSCGLIRTRRQPGNRRRRRPVSAGLERLEGRVLLAADGDFGFAFGLPGDGASVGSAIATDASDNVYVAGYFTGTADFDPSTGVTELTSTAGIGIPNGFIAKYTSDGALVWVRQLTGGSLDARALTLDDQGSVYATGFFSDTVDFDPGVATQNRTSQGSYDIFVLKLDNNGDFDFVTTVGGTERDLASDIVVDSQHNIYTVGEFGSTLDFDAGPGVQERVGSGNWDAFVYKLDSSGNFVFAQTFGSTSEELAYSIALDSQEDLYIAGSFTGTLDFDPGLAVQNRTSQGGSDGFVLHLDQDGNYGFVATLGGVGGDAAFAIDLDADDNIYYCGQFTGTVDFDPGAGVAERTSSQGFDTDSFVSKLDHNGNLLYASTFGGLFGEISAYLDVDRHGNAYVAGYYLGTVDFDPGVGIQNRTSNGGMDIFVSKFDTNGDFVFASSMGGVASGDSPNAIAVDSSGNAYTTGTFFTTADFDPGPDTYNLTGTEGSFYNLFVSKLIGSTANLGVSGSSGSETGETQITVTVTVAAPVSGDQTVDLAVTGTGITLADYILTDGDAGLSGIQIKILDGQMTGSVTFTVANDNLVELTETAVLSISNPSSGIKLGSTLEQQVTITDDDAAVISISNPSVTEGGTLSFDVSISNPVDVAVTADRATADGTATVGNSDYSSLATANVQLFAAGSTNALTVAVDTAADANVELDEVLSLILSNLAASGRNVTFSGGGVTLTGTGTITNNDIDLSVARDQISSQEGESGTTPFTFTVTRSGATNGTTTVGYAVTGIANATDFVGNALPSGIVTFAPGILTQTITINVQGDITVEPGESFTVTLSNATDSTGVNAIDIVTASDSSTITNDDIAPTLSITPDGTLTSAASIAFTFQFSRPMTGFTVDDINLTNGTAGTFTEITAGQYTLSVTPVSDGLVTVAVDAGKATDAGGNPNPAATASITSDRTGPVFSTGTSFEVAENTTAVETATATDTHGPVTYSLVTGGDAALFAVDSMTGVLAFVGAPDFENPADVNSDNVYIFQLKATDSLNVSTTQALTVTVTAVNENSPEFTSGATFQAAENTTAVGTVMATDTDAPGQTVTFSITGGVDSSLFSITNSGILTFKAAPDFEDPGDANENNVYEIEVTAADGQGLTKTQSVTVTVTNAGESPQLSNVTAVTWTKVRPPTAINVLPAVVVTVPGSLAGGTLSITMNTVGSKRKSADLLKAAGVATIGNGGDFVYDFPNHKLTLQIELGEQATAAKVEAFLRGITFITKGKGLKTLSRNLQVTLTDAGDLSASVNQTIHVKKKP